MTSYTAYGQRGWQTMQEKATDPNAAPADLLKWSRCWPRLVAQNPALPLLALENPGLVEQIQRRALWASLGNVVNGVPGTTWKRLFAVSCARTVLSQERVPPRGRLHVRLALLSAVAVGAKPRSALERLRRWPRPEPSRAERAIMAAALPSPTEAVRAVLRVVMFAELKNSAPVAQLRQLSEEADALRAEWGNQNRDGVVR